MLLLFLAWRQRGPIRFVLLVLIGWERSFLRNGSKDFSDFLHKLGDYKSRKVTEPDFWKKFLIWRYSRKGLQISPKSNTLIFFSKTAIFLVFGLKLVLNMTFSLNEIYFSEKLQFGDIWSRNCQKIAQIEVFGHSLDFASLVFIDFAHNARRAWCLVVFLQFAIPVNVFLLFLVLSSQFSINLKAHKMSFETK